MCLPPPLAPSEEILSPPSSHRVFLFARLSQWVDVPGALFLVWRNWYPKFPV